MNELEIFAKRLRTARGNARLTYTELAQKAGTSDAVICKIENGKNGATLITEDKDRLFKFILKCCRNRNKPDLHTFFIAIDKGRAYVECRKQEVYIVFYFSDDRPTSKWCATPVAAANRLDKYGAVYETIDM